VAEGPARSAGRRAVLRRLARIAATDNFGDHAGVGDGVSELRIDVGPGYRVEMADELE
jgi:putative addiction module killer protein